MQHQSRFKIMPILDFHKPPPLFKPRPPLCAKHYVNHLHKVFWPNSNTNVTIASHMWWSHSLMKRYNHYSYPLCTTSLPFFLCSAIVHLVPQQLPMTSHFLAMLTMTQAMPRTLHMSLKLALIQCACPKPVQPCQPCQNTLASPQQSLQHS
jgi:hypothetical protein